MLSKIYGNILDHPKWVLGFTLLCIAFLGVQIRHLDVDASAESLVLEDDLDLKYARKINARYATSDSLIITYSPERDLLSKESLADLAALKKELLQLDFVESVTSLLDVPLLESPPKPIKELLKNVPTIENSVVDLELARKEFLNSPVYKNMLVSADFKTSALLVNLHDNPRWTKLVNRRYQLREQQQQGEFTPLDQAELDQIQSQFKSVRALARQETHLGIIKVREVISHHREHGELFLGGVSMVADDMIQFIKNDLAIFGSGVVVFLVLTLWVIFRQALWIVVPVVACLASVVCTAGLLGLFGWEVTVISSNFVSLQLIITMALTIHLIVRYREVITNHPDQNQRFLVLETVLFMAKPCFYMALTTIAGFCSLLLSGILPVINFGWMMAAGITVSLLLTFILFPTWLVLLKPIQPNRSFEGHFALTLKLADLTEHRGPAILITSAVLMVLCIAGGLQLKVENSFISYFKQSTEIYQGMEVIDKQLGGTTPLDVVIDLPAMDSAVATAEDSVDGGGEFDLFEEEFEADAGQAQYWFTEERMKIVEKVHDYLDSLPEVGKVVSLGTMLKVGRRLNDGEPLDNFKLALIYNELPVEFKKILLDPYVSVENNQVRFYARVIDSEPSLRRDELLKRIKAQLPGVAHIEPSTLHMTGLLVLYNNMLQSLFDSQILTLGAVVVSLMVMFLILFRSFKIALIAILPNLLSVGTVLGVMGWVGIPLDMMTITIAAISVGIAVDDTIHYIHRFKEEFALDGNYLASMHRCHRSIGFAMYYTSVTIIIGFSILVLSNFIPSIYFGLLTGLAMVIALIAALTLLPQLIIVMKPFGEEAVGSQG